MQRRTRRERKAPERLTANITNTVTRYHGTGIVLGTSKMIKDGITAASDKIKVLLHRCIYHRQGSAKERLNNILSFQGFENEDQIEKFKSTLEKREESELKEIAEAVCLDSTKSNILDEITEFFKEPKRPRDDEVIDFVDQVDNEQKMREEEEREIEEELEAEDDDDNQEVFNEEDVEEEDDEDEAVFEEEESGDKEESDDEIYEEEEDEELDNVFDESTISEKKPRKKGTKEKKEKKDKKTTK